MSEYVIEIQPAEESVWIAAIDFNVKFSTQPISASAESLIPKRQQKQSNVHTLFATQTHVSRLKILQRMFSSCRVCQHTEWEN